MSSIPIQTLYTCKSKIRTQSGTRPSVITTSQCGFTTTDREEAQAHAEEKAHEVWGSPSGERFGSPS